MQVEEAAIKGELLLNEEGSEHIRKVRGMIEKNMVTGITLTGGGLFGIGFVLYDPRLLVTLVLGVPLFIVGVHLVRDGLRARRVIRDLKIFENGILLHWRTLEQASRDEENFVRFRDIEEVYMNPGLEYVTLKVSGFGNLEMDKNFITDLFLFEKIIGDKVTVKNSTEELKSEERWHVYSLARKGKTS